MKAVILAGGAGIRLREIVKDVPKPMASVAGMPFLEYLILQLIRWKITKIILSIGYKGEVIKSYFGNGRQWGAAITYSVEDEPLGTGGALKKAAGLIGDEKFIALNGDSLLDLNFGEIISYHKKKKAIATLGLVSVGNIDRYGKVEIDKNGKVRKFIEKKIYGEGLINGGVYVFNQEVIANIPDGIVSLEKEVLPGLINQDFYGMIVKGFFVDIGVPHEYLDLCENPKRLYIAAGLLL